MVLFFGSTKLIPIAFALVTLYLALAKLSLVTST
jgi:hypothetical protein